jgi:hypothetical protein
MVTWKFSKRVDGLQRLENNAYIKLWKDLIKALDWLSAENGKSHNSENHLNKLEMEVLND